MRGILTLKKNIYVLILGCALVIASFVTPLTAFAKKGNKSESELLGYAVKAVLPSTQLDTSKSYFYVQTIPGEEQTLEIKVKSTRPEPVKLKVTIEDAMTADNGEIGYRSPNDKSVIFDETLKEPVSSILSIENSELTVANFEEKAVRLKVKPTKEHYKGVKIGSVSINLAEEEGKGGVKTGFGYEIGVIFSETGEEFNNSEVLELKSVEPKLYYGKKTVLVNLQNPEPKVLENLTISASVKDKKTSNTIKEKKVQGYRMAPNSNLNFSMDWGIAALPSGIYILEMDVKNEFNNWSFKKEFQITNKQANEINSQSPFAVITPLLVQIASGILGILTIIIIVLQISRKRKWEKRWGKLKLSRKKKKKRKKRKVIGEK